jgi:hypothetical protein
MNTLKLLAFAFLTVRIVRNHQMNRTISLTLYPRMGARDILDIPPRHSHFTIIIYIYIHTIHAKFIVKRL